MPKRKTRKKQLAPMHPRERLTAKAKAAISQYVIIKAGKMLIHCRAIHFTLEAERMPRERLYEWLESRGYKWWSEYGVWREKAK